MHVNRIRPELSREALSLYPAMMDVLYRMARFADFALAHNAAFDKKWLQNRRPVPARPAGSALWRTSAGHVTQKREAWRYVPGPDYGVPVWSAHRAD